MAVVRALLEEWPLLLAMGSLLLFTVALLCGNWPMFDGTPIRSLHLWLAGGACDWLQRILGMLCGAKGVQGYLYMEHICCERPNPILQLFYLSIVFGAFGIYFHTSFQYIPGPYVPAFHRYFAPLAVMVGVGFFLAASFCDPGTLTPSNVAQHNKYEFDGILFQEKICPTCHIPRPARSKHCSICNRCIARFDHHCAWMNNCIGANNLRYFLMFLIWHCFLCWYGAFVMIAILAGEVSKHRIMQRIAFFYGTNSFYDKFPHLVHWIVAFYSPQFLLLLFLVIISVLLLAFLSYHLLLVIRNTTTNEVYKWELHELRLAHEAELEGRQAAEQQGCCCSLLGTNEASKPKFTAYNRGAVNNFHEVLFPVSRSWCKKEE